MGIYQTALIMGRLSFSLPVKHGNLEFRVTDIDSYWICVVEIELWLQNLVENQSAM